MKIKSIVFFGISIGLIPIEVELMGRTYDFLDRT